MSGHHVDDIDSIPGHEITKLNREEIQSLFDQQIEGIMKRIIEQLDWMSENGRTEQVVSLIAVRNPDTN